LPASTATPMAMVTATSAHLSKFIRDPHLQDQKLVERVGHGRWRPRREALLDRFLGEYPGPGGSERFSTPSIHLQPR
jgi:hypothetical protein